MDKSIIRGTIVRYLKMTGFILLFMLVYYLMQAVVGTVFTFIYAFRAGIGNSTLLNVNQLKNEVLRNTGLIIFFSGLLALPVYLIVSVCRGESFFRASGFKKTGIRSLGLSALMGAGASIFLAMAFSFIPVDRWFPDYGEMMDSLLGSGNIFGIILGTGVMAPFIEEIIFRGLIQKELEKNLPVTAAVIIQGILFGLYHGNPLQIIYTAPLGILLGFVYVWTRSIWAPMVVHAFLNNTSTFLSKVLGEEISGYYVVLALVLGLLASAFTIHTMLKEGRGEQPFYLEDNHIRL